MLATTLLFATSIIPHHHHDDGSICISLEMDRDLSNEHNHSHNGCDNDCAMNIDVVQDANQPGHASKAWLLPILSAVILWDNTLIPSPEESNHKTNFIYIEHATPGIVCHSCGLRAPPAMA